MASTGSVDGWPLGPMELGEAGLRVLLRQPTQASSSYTELKLSCARHDVRIRISSYVAVYMDIHTSRKQDLGTYVPMHTNWVSSTEGIHCM